MPEGENIDDYLYDEGSISATMKFWILFLKKEELSLPLRVTGFLTF